MKRTEIFALIVAGILFTPAIIFLYLGLLKLVDIISIYMTFSAAAIGSILVWGFKDRIFSKLSESNSDVKATSNKKPPNDDDDGYILGIDNKKGFKSKLRDELRDVDENL